LSPEIQPNQKVVQSYKFLKPNSEILHRFTFNSVNLVLLWEFLILILKSKELLTLNVTLKVSLQFTMTRETSHKDKKNSNHLPSE